MYVCMYVCMYPAPPHRQHVGWGWFLNREQLVWIQSFPSPRLVVQKKEPSLSFYLPIAGENRSVSFTSKLTQSKKPIASSE